jgi:hypothetical protein
LLEGFTARGEYFRQTNQFPDTRASIADRETGFFIESTATIEYFREKPGF